MRFGYSIESGQALDAADITYEQTRKMQITCPACNEPVIKVVRPHGAGTSNYLKHHKSAATAEERASQVRCEHRTSWLTRDGATAMARSGIDRGQDLEGFMAVFRDRLATTVEAFSPGLAARMPAIDEGPEYRSLIDGLWEHGIKIHGKGWEANGIGDEINEIVGRNVITPENILDVSGFVGRTLAHLNTPVARDNQAMLDRMACLLSYVVPLEEAEEQDALKRFPAIRDIRPETDAGAIGRAQSLFIGASMNLHREASPRRLKVEIARRYYAWHHGRGPAMREPQHVVLDEIRFEARILVRRMASMLVAMMSFVDIPDQQPKRRRRTAMTKATGPAIGTPGTANDPTAATTAGPATTPTAPQPAPAANDDAPEAKAAPAEDDDDEGEPDLVDVLTDDQIDSLRRILDPADFGPTNARDELWASDLLVRCDDERRYRSDQRAAGTADTAEQPAGLTAADAAPPAEEPSATGAIPMTTDVIAPLADATMSGKLEWRQATDGWATTIGAVAIAIGTRGDGSYLLMLADADQTEIDRIEIGERHPQHREVAGLVGFLAKRARTARAVSAVLGDLRRAVGRD